MSLLSNTTKTTGAFDIRLVLSRTLLYTLMVALIIAAYAGIVAGLSLLVPADAQRRVSIGAGIVEAAPR